MARRLRQAFTSWRLRAVVGGFLLALVVLALSVALSWFVPLPERLLLEGSVSVRDSEGETLHVFLAPDGRWRVPIELAEADPAYLEALLRFEDKRFMTHGGVDLFAIARALRLNLGEGRVVSGGSTITMQVVRLVEPRPRTLRSKLTEVLRAIQLEVRMDKAEILTSYLNFASFGRNVEGLEAGSLACFGHRPEHLSPAEIATLLAIPQNPQPRYPNAKNRDRLKEARDRIARRLFSAEEAAQVVAEPVPRNLRRLPREAPHLAYWLRSRVPAHETVIETSIQKGLQRRVEERMGAASEDLALRGIQHGTAVVIDHHTMELVAVAGNLSWDAETSGRQIPAFAVPRSPGSTLKPFIYAQAIDEGLSLPAFLVPDVPVQYGDYSPSNYDGSFDGLVPLEDALSRSLNIPFVELLGSIETDRFLGRLHRMGAVELVDDPGYYGLSVAVGGIELRPLEVAVLYATLARGGVYQPLQIVGGTPEQEEGDAVFSEASAYLTRRALARRDRPGFGSRSEIANLRETIHWKTGTSSGRRDAWAVGSGSRFTVAVWLGNLDNSSTAHLVGSDAAGPLFFDLVEAVHRNTSAVADHRPNDLVEVRVCSYSGHPPGDGCEVHKQVLARVDKVPTTICPYHRRIEVDVETGLAVGAGCREGRRTELRSYLTWPSSIHRWLQRRSGALPSPPDWSPDCTLPSETSAPTIIHPPVGHVALLMPGMEADRQQVPLVAEARDGTVLDWFVDGRFIGRASAEERIWWTPTPGKHQIVASDARGRIARRGLEVRVRR